MKTKLIRTPVFTDIGGSISTNSPSDVLMDYAECESPYTVDLSCFEPIDGEAEDVFASDYYVPGYVGP